MIHTKIEKRKQQEIDRQNGIGVRRVSNNLIIETYNDCLKYYKVCLLKILIA